MKIEQRKKGRGAIASTECLLLLRFPRRHFDCIASFPQREPARQWATSASRKPRDVRKTTLIMLSATAAVALSLTDQGEWDVWLLERGKTTASSHVSTQRVMEKKKESKQQ